MTDIYVSELTSVFNEKELVFFEFGKFRRPFMIIEPNRLKRILNDIGYDLVELEEKPDDT